ncbi:MAG: hypothetical protein NZ779_13865 [Alteromonas macleodii]|nr:hypothetical protein [Alteromonas macleodii]
MSFSCVVNIRNECYAFDAKKIEVDLMTLTFDSTLSTLDDLARELGGEEVS